MSLLKNLMNKAKELFGAKAQDVIQDTVDNVKDSVLGGDKKPAKHTGKGKSRQADGFDLNDIGEMIDGARQTLDGITGKKRK
ncbi:MAG: hypothetical protein Q4F02_03000 [Candidatus Saccharibacteria bacterium]|nr:hypothetical protein [Candidatus Saccharibacteria bacterium]